MCKRDMQTVGLREGDEGDMAYWKETSVVAVYTKVGRQIVPQSGVSARESSTTETF